MLISNLSFPIGSLEPSFSILTCSRNKRSFPCTQSLFCIILYYFRTERLNYFSSSYNQQQLQFLEVLNCVPTIGCIYYSSQMINKYGIDHLFHRTQVNSVIPEEIDQWKELSRDKNFCFPITFRVPNLTQHRAELLRCTKCFPESKKVTSIPRYLDSSYMASLTKTYTSGMAAKGNPSTHGKPTPGRSVFCLIHLFLNHSNYCL